MKTELSGQPEQQKVTVTADAGTLIAETCVKAGTDVVKQLIEPALASVTIESPSKRAISHYAVRLVADAGPKPADRITVAEWSAYTADCTTKIATSTRTVTTTPFVLSNGKWVESTPTVRTETQTRPVTEAECSTDPGPKPADRIVTTEWSAYTADCDTDVATSTRTVTTTPHVLVNGQWIEGEPTTTVESQTRPVTEQECPTEEQPPVVETCPGITAGGVATNLDPNGWTFGETRATGHNDFVSGGLRVWTESNASTDKAAGYKALNVPLSKIGQPSISFASYEGVRPGLQLGIDKDADGDWDGFLVGEPWAYGDGNWWSSKNFGIAGGMGYASFGTLNDHPAANPDAVVLNFGYSLGSGVKGDATITSITVGCKVYTFDRVEPAKVEPRIQDYVNCEGGAFVLDNTGSNRDVTYTVNGVKFLVPAGKAVHTDADGKRIQPVDGKYVVTAGDRSWTFDHPCEPRIQDYISCEGGAFVLDNIGSSLPVTYVINGVEFVVPAGKAVHTDAEGDLIAAVDGEYVITAAGQSWTFDAESCPIVIDAQPEAPVFVDECGTADDAVELPADTEEYFYEQKVVDGKTVVTVVAKDGFEFEEGVTTKWEHVFAEVTCEVPPTVITQHPLAPVFLDECGTADDEVILPDDTDEFYYEADLEDGMTVVTVVARDGFALEDETVTSWVRPFTDEPCTVQTVVTPPAPHVTVTPQVAVAPQVKSIDRTPAVEREVLAYTGADDAATTRDAAIGGSLLLLGVLALGFARLRRQHR